MTASLIFGVGLVLIVVLYLLKVRRRSIAVPFGGLWGEILGSEKRSFWLQHLKRVLSLLLWAFLLLLVTLALLDPRPEEDTSLGRNIVILVDASASMNAIEENDQTRLDLAKIQIQQKIDELHPNDRVIILEASGQIRTVSGEFSNDSALLHNAVSELQATATTFPLSEALQTAIDLLQDKPLGEIVLYSDGQFSNAGMDVDIFHNINFEQVLVGTKHGNLAIESFNVRRYPTNKKDYEIFLQVKNGFSEPIDATVGIYNLIKDPQNSSNYIYKLIEEKDVKIASNASEIRFYQELPLASRHLAARIHLKTPTLRDPLELDNEAFVLIPEYVKPRILCITPSNLFLEAALLLNENDSVDFLKPEHNILHPNGSSEISLENIAEEYDIFIFDNSYYEQARVSFSPTQPGNYLFINPDKDNSPFNLSPIKEPLLERVNHKHPIAQQLSLKTLNIAQASVFKLQKSDTMVLRAIEGPLIITRQTESQKYVAIGFSLVESDIIFRIALPMLIMNSIDWFMTDNSNILQAYRTDNPWHIPVSSSYKAVHITDPMGNTTSRIPQYHGEVTFYATQPGFYRITNSDDPHEFFEVAANFSHARESDLSSDQHTIPASVRSEVGVAEGGSEAQVSRGFWNFILSIFPSSIHNLWVIFLLLASILVFVEWITFHKRWTV